jgi:hypothetical protein
MMAARFQHTSNTTSLLHPYYIIYDRQTDGSKTLRLEQTTPGHCNKHTIFDTHRLKALWEALRQPKVHTEGCTFYIYLAEATEPM